jgi:uncharacterized protein DUF4350
MSGEPIFPQRVLVGWIAAAVAVFAISLYFMGGGQLGDPAAIGPSTFSRSAIGHAGIADVLQRLNFPVVKSQYNSLDKLTSGSVLVIAEPAPGGQSEHAIRTLLKADTILIVLPKWTGQRSEKKPEWLAQVNERNISDAQWALRLVAPRADVARQSTPVTWTTNTLGLAPNVVEPTQLIRGDRLVPIIGSADGMLIGEIADRNRKIWILSDPDVISNYGLARAGNAALAAALIARLRGPNGAVVFDETIHGFTAQSSNPFTLMFRFPFVIATAQAAIAIALLLWASIARFGAPQTAPAPLSVGRQGLLQNVANLIEFTGHQQVMIRRYVQETIRDAARQLHAPGGLAGEQLVTWLQRVGTARGVEVDCGAVVQRASELADARRRDLTQLVRLARDIHRWKREIIDGPSRNSRTH